MGWGAGHSRVTGREAAQGTLDTRPRCLAAHKPTNNPEALQTRPRGLGIPCLPTLNLPTMKPLWCPARSNEDDDEEHLITQGGPGFPEKRGGADILAYRAEGAAPGTPETYSYLRLLRTSPLPANLKP